MQKSRSTLKRRARRARNGRLSPALTRDRQIARLLFYGFDSHSLLAIDRPQRFLV